MSGVSRTDKKYFRKRLMDKYGTSDWNFGAAFYVMFMYHSKPQMKPFRQWVLLLEKYPELAAFILENNLLTVDYAKDVLHWQILGSLDFYISKIVILWDYMPEKLKNNPDIMTAYFKEMIL